MKRKILLLGIILFLVGSVFAVTIIVSSDSEAQDIFSAKAAPKITQNFCKVLKAQKVVSDDKQITEFSTQVEIELNYSLNDKNEAILIPLQTKETKLSDVQKAVADACDAKFLEITATEIASPPMVIIDYLKGALASLTSSVYDLDKKEWVATTVGTSLN